jgi:hypothetical protein
VTEPTPSPVEQLAPAEPLAHRGHRGRPRPVRARSLRVQGRPPSLPVLQPGDGTGEASEEQIVERPRTRGDCIGGPRPCSERRAER